MAAVASNDVWAVGEYDHYSDYWDTLIEHWNGNAWSVVRGPSGGMPSIAGVAAASDGTIWMAGSFTPSGTTPRTYVQRFAPCTPTPTVTGIHLTATSTVTPSLTMTATPIIPVCGQWPVVVSPNEGAYSNYLEAFAAAAPTAVWAVGTYYEGNPAHTLIQGWDGSTWRTVPSPNQGTSYNYLQRVAAAASNDVWAVGYYVSGLGERPLVERWNGSAWTIMPAAPSGDSRFSGVAAAGPNDVWAVGRYFGFDYRFETLVERWNGTTWSVVPSPNMGSGTTT